MRHLLLLCLLALVVGCAAGGSGGDNPNAAEGGDASEGGDALSDDDTRILPDNVNPGADVTPPKPDTTIPEGAWHEDCPQDTREQRLIDVGDIHLNVACRGSGPTIVFLHGFPEFHYSWDKVMDELATEFRLVAPDQRGYNTSDKPEDIADYALPLLTQDILNLLPLISPDPVILVAHDWGGPVGWMVAHDPNAHIRAFISTNGPHPARLADLIANDPAQQSASSYVALFRMPGTENSLTPEVLGPMLGDALTPEDLVEYTLAWTQPGAIAGGLNWYRANDLTPESTAELMAATASKVSVPTVVMWGMDDAFVLPSNAEGLEPWVADLTVQTFPGVDHWIEHRIPAEIAQVIRDLDVKTR